MQVSIEYAIPILAVIAAAALLLHLRLEKRRIRHQRHRKQIRGIEVIVDDTAFSQLRRNAPSETDYQTAERSFLRALGNKGERDTIERRSTLRAKL